MWSSVGLLFVLVVQLWSPVASSGCSIFRENYGPCGSTELVVSFGVCVIQKSTAAAGSVPRIGFQDAEVGAEYLLIMVDPDAPSRSRPTRRWWRHWVLADITGSSLKSQPIATLGGTTVTAYNGPSPPRGTGDHRYQFYLFKQPTSFDSDALVSELRDADRGGWNFKNFVADNDLCGQLVAAYQFKTRNE